MLRRIPQFLTVSWWTNPWRRDSCDTGRPRQTETRTEKRTQRQTEPVSRPWRMWGLLLPYLVFSLSSNALMYPHTPVIRPGTRAAHGVSASDMAKRQQNEMWKRQMLRNLHMFISRERLCVHNLPPKMTDKQLGKLFKKHSSKTAKIVEV